MSGDLLWEPSDERVARATMTRYMRERGFDDYESLRQWSVDDLEGFWASVWDFFEVDSDYEQVLADRSMPGAQWFPGARVNYAEHIFRGKADDQVAMLARSEVRPDLRSLTWGEVREQTARVAAGLKRLGVEPGDRVVAYMPNIPETMIAFLAVSSLGAVWSSCSPDFGPRSVVDRFAQIEPKVLLAVDGYRYGGKDFDRRETVDGLRGEMPTLEHTVLLPYLGCGELDDTLAWDELTGEHEDLTFERMPFDHPLWVLYSSGTTGLPNAIVQGHGGILLEHYKLMGLHVDAQAGDRVFWFTTTGWMMWNFLVGVLLTEAAVVLYDGNPATPDLSALWQLAEDARITTFGTSAAYIATCLKEGVRPREGRSLERLRNVGSTGSPLAPEGFPWVYARLRPGGGLFLAGGGPEVCPAFVGGVPLLPVYEGELQARALGCAVEAWDEEGRPVTDEVGELVITEPMPSMPLYFWNDPDGERYRESYFEQYPGIWRHGDWIEITSRGTAIITGRSDSTINRGGIRMGTAEIYSAVFELDEIQDALVVDVPRDGEDWMPLFVVLREGAELDDELVKRIRSRLPQEGLPRHGPNEVRAIAEVPRPMSGKLLEVPDKKILMGVPAPKAASRDSLANPRSLDYFTELASQKK